MPVKPVPHYVATQMDKRPTSCGRLPGASLFLEIPLFCWNAEVLHMVAVACLQHPAKKGI
jgi:hypothetical protein